MSDETTHTPPQDIDAEAALLGAMLMSPNVALTTRTTLTREEFYRPAHRLVFDAILNVMDSTGGVDELLVVNALRDAGEIGNAGGPAYVFSLSQTTPALANAGAYADRVKEVATRRRLVDTGHEIARLGYEGEDDPVSHAERLLASIVEDGTDDEGEGGAAEAVDAAAAWLERYHEPDDGEHHTFVPYTMPELTERCGAMRPGQTIVVSGYEKHGKTWQVMDTAEAFLQRGERVLFASMELSADEIHERLVAMGGHDYSKLQDRELPFDTFSDRHRQVAAWPLTTLTGNCTVTRIKSHLMRARLQGKPYRAVIVDHVGLLDTYDTGIRDSTPALDDAIRRLGNATMQFGVTTLLVAQLRKPNPKDGMDYPVPRPSDLRGTAAIGQIAHVVMFVWQHAEGGRPNGTGKILIPYMRSRKPATPIDVRFHGLHRNHQSYRFRPPSQTTPRSANPEAEQQGLDALKDTFGAQDANPTETGIPF